MSAHGHGTCHAPGSFRLGRLFGEGLTISFCSCIQALSRGSSCHPEASILALPYARTYTGLKSHACDTGGLLKLHKSVAFFGTKVRAAPVPAWPLVMVSAEVSLAHAMTSLEARICRNSRITLS